MKIIWTTGAAEDLAAIVSHINRDSEEAGRRLASFAVSKAQSLSSMPQRGRHQMPEDTWELLLTPWPYVIVYELLEGAVSIHGIRHTSRDSPRRR